MSHRASTDAARRLFTSRKESRAGSLADAQRSTERWQHDCTTEVPHRSFNAILPPRSPPDGAPPTPPGLPANFCTLQWDHTP